MREMGEQYMAARGIEKRIREIGLPARAERAMTAGNTSSSGHRGTTTWAEWLGRDREAASGRMAA